MRRLSLTYWMLAGILGALLFLLTPSSSADAPVGLAGIGAYEPVALPEDNPVLDEVPYRDNLYAVVGIWNHTNKVIKYQFRWGSKPWITWTILPGQRRWQAWTFATPNQSHWPIPAIRFDMDGRTGSRLVVTQQLTAYAAPERGYWYGDRFEFVTGADGYTIELRRVVDEGLPVF